VNCTPFCCRRGATHITRTGGNASQRNPLHPELAAGAVLGAPSRGMNSSTGTILVRPESNPVTCGCCSLAKIRS